MNLIKIELVLRRIWTYGIENSLSSGNKLRVGKKETNWESDVYQIAEQNDQIKSLIISLLHQPRSPLFSYFLKHF